MDTLNILGIGLIIAICGLIVIYVLAYILAIILWEISFTRKIICKTLKYEYNDFPKYSNTRDNGSNQRYVFDRIHNYIKCFPIAFYRLWRQDGLRGKPIGNKRGNNTNKSNPNISPNPINIDMPNKADELLHREDIISKGKK